MATQRSSFEKLARDRAKKEKAAAKREKRQERAAGAATPLDVDAATDAALTDEGGLCSPAELLRMIESIHQRFEAGTMSFEDFEDARVNLLGRLPVD